MCPTTSQSLAFGLGILQNSTSIYSSDGTVRLDLSATFYMSKWVGGSGRATTVCNLGMAAGMEGQAGGLFKGVPGVSRMTCTGQSHWAHPASPRCDSLLGRPPASAPGPAVSSHLLLPSPPFNLAVPSRLPCAAACRCCIWVDEMGIEPFLGANTVSGFQWTSLGKVSLRTEGGHRPRAGQERSGGCDRWGARRVTTVCHFLSCS